MARPLRIEFPGAFYHVMNRGNTGMDIYRSERDREKFLEYVGEAVKRYGIKVHTYCLMTTHYHFLIETPHANLSQAIKWINVGYACISIEKGDASVICSRDASKPCWWTRMNI